MKVRLLICLLVFLVIGQNVWASTPTPQTPPFSHQEALALAGLDGEVTVKYDTFDVPYIYASTDHDLYMIQGYLHAQNRWWQMEWSRHQGRGELASLMGENLVGTDIFLRTMGLVGQAEANYDMMSDEYKAILDAYSAGVNAWLADQTPQTAAPEYGFLKLLGNPQTEIEPWTPLDSVVWGQAVALSFTQGAIEYELLKQGLIDAGGPLAPLLLAPPYDYEKAPLVSEPGRPITLLEYPETALPSIANWDVSKLPDFTVFPFPTFQERGSNSWVVGGELTDTGLPYLANDPHIGQNNPSVWIENGLHCVELNESCTMNAFGYVFPGSPGILIGHNDHLAWGMTVSGLDAADVYKIKVNPDNPLQYEFDGEMLDMEVRTETIEVANGDPVEAPILITRFGPMINQLVGFEQPLALRALLNEPSRSMEVTYWLSHATNWDEFQAAVELFDFTGQNFAYADVEGNIAVITGGKIPLRVEGHDGTLPVDGSTGEYDWQGFIEKADNPRIVNPETHYIVASNNAYMRPEAWAELGTTHAVYYDWGYRAARAETLIRAYDEHSLETMQAIQTDNFNSAAAIAMPVLSELEFDDPDLSAAINWLSDWDMMNNAESGQAALFNAFWLKLMPLAFDEMAAAGGVSGGSKEIYIMTNMIGGDHPLWNNAELGTNDREEILKMAFEQGYQFLVDELGPSPDEWRWDAVHFSYPKAVPFGSLPRGASQVLDALLADFDRFFNRKYGVNGGLDSINNVRWDARNGNMVVSGSIVSMRMIVDFSDLDNTLMIHELGQSGDPVSPHFDDMSPLWATGQYRDHAFTPEGVDSITVREVTFDPAE